MLAANTKTINTFKNKNAKLNKKLKQKVKRKTKAIFGESTLRHAMESEDEMTFFWCLRSSRYRCGACSLESVRSILLSLSLDREQTGRHIGGDPRCLLPRDGGRAYLHNAAAVHDYEKMLVSKRSFI